MATARCACQAGLLFACAALVASSEIHNPGRQLQQTYAQAPSVPLAAVEHYDWNITLSQGAPDCFQRNIILVNNSFQPVLEVVQGNILEITVHNNLPAWFIDVAGGISLHWHGFSLVNNSWYDGTNYGSQCPIKVGQSFTYRFPVNEPAGTYLWHDHSQLYRSDGLNGVLIVKPREGSPEAWQYDADYPMLLGDWFHGEGDSLGITLNRPFDLTKANNITGHWRWIGLPQSLLINGHGMYQDCVIPGGLGDVAGSANYSANCSVQYYDIPPGRSVQQPEADPNNPGCSHTNFTVEEGGVYRFRIVANTLEAIQTICFEKHNITLIAVDAVPTEPISFGECMDVNSGQRADILLTADQEPGNYWITTQMNYRVGGPNGYAVLHYEGSSNHTLPTTPTPQPGAAEPLTLSQINSIETNRALLSGDESDSSAKALVENFRYFPGDQTTLAVPNADRLLGLNISQPLIEPTGQLRWAFNNIVQPSSPPCTPLLRDIALDQDWLGQHLAAPGFDTVLDPYEQVGNGSDALVFEAFSPMPLDPVTGLHVLQTDLGEVIEIVIQNGPGNAFNGDYRGGAEAASRNGSEAHPFHMHGHHFWLLATGNGTWDPSTSPAEYNLDNPAYRDTLTVLKGGWAALRFVSDNPGVWPFHCHLDAHFVIGHAMYIVEGTDRLPPMPEDMPVCSATCNQQFGPNTVPFVDSAYPDEFGPADNQNKR
ncbi:hypothetical protein WJX73_006180 [Symbiochloris irregularis]|uniref:Laccase n=1 Tax=Symbiochloris irregularis TaxID=706552 RepID=A0AAW1NS83_9CHLO